MIKHFCDRCGAEIPKNDQSTYVIPKDQDGDTPICMRLEYELCLCCKRKLIAFLEGREDAIKD